MEADGSVLRRVGDLRRQEHRREGHDVQVRAEREVLVDPLGDRDALAAIALVAEERPAVLFRGGGERVRPSAAVRRHVDAHDFVAGLRQTGGHVTAEGGLSEDREFERRFLRHGADGTTRGHAFTRPSRATRSLEDRCRQAHVRAVPDHMGREDPLVVRGHEHLVALFGVRQVGGGEFEGPRLRGRLRSSGCADWATRSVRPSSTRRPSWRIPVRTCSRARYARPATRSGFFSISKKRGTVTGILTLI